MEKILKTLRSEHIKDAIYFSTNYALRMLYFIVSLLSVKKGRICFSNYNGKGYGDNPKYVAEALLKMDSNIELFWIASKKCVVLPDNVVPVKLYSLSGFVAFATSKVWVSNARLPLFLRKKKSQKYYQLWHGGCGPKKIEGTAEGNLIGWYVSCAKHDSKMADYIVSNSKFNSEMICKYFWYNGEILNYGSPRYDVFFRIRTVLSIQYQESLEYQRDAI